MAESKKLETESLLNLAQIGKVSKETEFMEAKEQLDVLDNQIDAEIKARELEDKKEDRQINTQLKILEMGHKGKTELAKMAHQIELKKQESANSTSNNKE